MWTGTLSFGLVTLPVRLYPATHPKDVRFHLYDREGRRIRYQRVVEAGAEPASDRNELPPSAAAADEDTPAREERRIAIGRFVLRTKPHLVAIRPMEKVLAVETMFFGDEVRDPADLAPGLDGVEVDERELDLAVTLIETLKTDWDPDAYADTYREELLRMLAERAPTKRAAEEPSPAGGSAVEELMAALKESVAAAKRDRTPKKATG